MIGSTVSHYRILSDLGRGGMGVVYRAQDTKLGRIVALKFLPAQARPDSEARQHFLQEARAASTLDHQNVCTIHEVGESDSGRAFIAMSCYDGGTLKDRIKDGPIPIERAIDFAAQTAEGLAVAHQAGIIHRDIKPSNLMVATRNVIKIVDFGLARVADVTLTTSGQRTGTVAYMSPEQARGERVDARTDIWSLGASLYEMVAGVKPFDAPFQSAVLYSILNVDPTPPREHNPDVSEALQEVITGCLEKDREKRYASARTVAADLRLLEAGKKIAGPRAIVEEGQRPVNRRRPFVAAALVIGLVLIAAINPIRKRFFPQGQELPLRQELTNALALAVLPAFEEFSTPEEQALLEGFSHYISRVLIDFESVRQPLWTAPYFEIMYHDLSASQDVAGQVYVESVVRPRVRADSTNVNIAFALDEARTGVTLRQANVSGRWQDVSFLQTDLVSTLSGLLQVNLTREEIDLLLRGGTSHPTAFREMLVGLGYLRRPSTDGNPDRALEHFQTAVELDSGYVAARVLLASARFTKSADVDAEAKKLWLDGALHETEEALRLDSLNASGHLLRGMLLNYVGRPVIAEQSFGRALEIEPANRNAFKQLINLLESQNRLLDAEEMLYRYRDANPFYWYTHLSLGNFYDSMLKYEEAIPHYERVIELAPDNAWGYVALAFEQMSLKNFAVAESLCRQALVINPRAADAISRAHYGLGVISYSKDHFAAAADHFAASLSLDDEYFDAWDGLGDAAYWMGDPDGAEVAWTRAKALIDQELAMTPNLPDVLEVLAVVQAKLGLEEEALQSIESILARKRIPDATQVSIGTAYEILGKRLQAIEHIKLAIANGYDRDEVQTSRWLDSLTKDRRYLCQLEGAPCGSLSD